MNLAIGLCLGFALGVAAMLGHYEGAWQTRMQSMQRACEGKGHDDETAFVAWRDEHGFACAYINEKPAVWAPKRQVIRGGL